MKQMALFRTCALFDEIRDAVSCHAELATLSALDQRVFSFGARDQNNARPSRISQVRIFFFSAAETGWRIVPSLKSPASASSKFSYRSSLQAQNHRTALSDLASLRKRRKASLKTFTNTSECIALKRNKKRSILGPTFIAFVCITRLGSLAPIIPSTAVLAWERVWLLFHVSSTQFRWHFFAICSLSRGERMVLLTPFHGSTPTALESRNRNFSEIISPVPRMFLTVLAGTCLAYKCNNRT